MTKDGAPILEVPASDTVATGVGYSVEIDGLVPPYEEHDARIEAGYNLTQWAALAPGERALEVAHYRLRKAKSLHEQAAVARAARPRGGRRR